MRDTETESKPIPRKVLVTGGAGYIGSTICSALEDSGHSPVVLDSLVNGREAFVRSHPFYRGDISDPGVLSRVFEEHPDISFAVHCAALAVVPDSVSRPYDYYKNNVTGSSELFRILAEFGCDNIVFSSSAAVYDNVPGFMVTEDSPTRPQSPYARSKLMTEMMLEDMAAGYGLKAISLRYFNPIGADPRMRSGQVQREATQIVNVLVSVANGDRPIFQVTGTDWPTRDGTGIRDYIHVWDLAQAHVKAVERIDDVFPDGPGFVIINLGTGSGVTVREIVSAFENVYGSPIPQEDAPPRPGDVAGAYANADKAAELLGWQTTMTLEEGIRDALAWAESLSFS
ncbi:MAG: UDP-glucose 4-epimerase GalE [Dehalococcoidia bacterium]|nr:UDP-glucose 4-epimerase GalE [Dehalococcoidia bacterium]